MWLPAVSKSLGWVKRTHHSPTRWACHRWGRLRGGTLLLMWKVDEWKWAEGDRVALTKWCYQS
jgi:hypothetical protein